MWHYISNGLSEAKEYEIMVGSTRNAIEERVRGKKSAIQKASILTSDERKIRRNEHGLTAKQEEFAMGVANGLTLAAAYRAAYDAEDMKLSSIYTTASQLMDRPAVAQRIKWILDDRYNRSLIHNVAHVRQHVFDRLMAESMDSKSPAMARIQATVWLGKVDIVGMFKEKAEVTVTDKRDVETIEEELKAKMRRYIEGQVIDNNG